MIDYDAILHLYTNVLCEDILLYDLSPDAIRIGIQNMKDVYAPNPTNLQSDVVNVANYNDAAHRCAYLHKYAPLHTCMVKDVMLQILNTQSSVFNNIMSESKKFKLCSLGGGPGTDVIGVIAALLTVYNNFKMSVRVVDCMINWKLTFASIIRELCCGGYDPRLSQHVANNLEWKYIDANLLSRMTNKVNKAIASASLVTMIKFVSAAACIDTENMLHKILRCMKPGSLILFIDNAGGGFHYLLTKAAREYKFTSVFGPVKHEHYTKHELQNKKFGYTNCCSTVVTIHLLQKPSPKLSQNFCRRNSVDNQNSVTKTNLTSKAVQNKTGDAINFLSEQTLSSKKSSENMNINKNLNTIAKQPELKTTAKLSPKSNNTINNSNNKNNSHSSYTYSRPFVSSQVSLPAGSSKSSSKPDEAINFLSSQTLSANKPSENKNDIDGSSTYSSPLVSSQVSLPAGSSKSSSKPDEAINFLSSQTLSAIKPSENKNDIHGSCTYSSPLVSSQVSLPATSSKLSTIKTDEAINFLSTDEANDFLPSQTLYANKPLENKSDIHGSCTYSSPFVSSQMSLPAASSKSSTNTDEAVNFLPGQTLSANKQSKNRNINKKINTTTSTQKSKSISSKPSNTVSDINNRNDIHRSHNTSISSEPLIGTVASDDDPVDDSNETCCSCCVIS